MYIFSINDVMGACPQTVGKSNSKYKAPMGNIFCICLASFLRLLIYM
jgi:hypothetical protein